MISGSPISAGPVSGSTRSWSLGAILAATHAVASLVARTLRRPTVDAKTKASP